MLFFEKNFRNVRWRNLQTTNSTFRRFILCCHLELFVFVRGSEERQGEPFKWILEENMCLLSLLFISKHMEWMDFFTMHRKKLAKIKKYISRMFSAPKSMHHFYVQLLDILYFFTILYTFFIFCIFLFMCFSFGYVLMHFLVFGNLRTWNPNAWRRMQIRGW